MKKSNYNWMKYSIKLAEKQETNKLQVAAIIVNNGNIVCESNNSDWSKDLLEYLNDKNITFVDTLFLTINTLNNYKNDFDLNYLLQKIEVNNIFLGLPDPSLNRYLEIDPILNKNNIYRYPEDLQEKIFNQNVNLYKNSKQNIENSEYYYSNRISQFLKDDLNLNNIDITTEEILQYRGTEKLSNYISTKYNLSLDEANDLINKILSNAFDIKYSKYDYSNDIRSLNVKWKENFKIIYHKTSKKPLSANKIINIGVGNGNEAKILFKDCDNITFVDIAPNGLSTIKELFTKSKIIKGRAEDLKELDDNSYDLYVSLRTYNSSFFDTKKAIKEAYRILKNNSSIIISISNGFLDSKEKKLIPGVIIPKLNYVDLYRGLDIAKSVTKEMLKYNFINIELTPTNGEIYISAKIMKE